ncbi:MAG: PQQ-dependent sugar dehydrogenase [Actinomycetota bacterium]|nr:PQQ-dependent sugar dehydrogenase [Actinomycetota bacterium]
MRELSVPEDNQGCVRSVSTTGRHVTPSLTRALVAVMLIVGCSDGGDRPDRAETLVSEVVATGFVGPTQLSVGGDGGWYLSQLNGGENDENGQVLRLDPDDLGAAPQVVLDGLDKPTGVAVFAGDLWVMERRRLSRFALDGSDPRVIADDMAFNGRSEGTLTVDGDHLLFDTAGNRNDAPDLDGTPQTSSGTLWQVDADGTIEALATGFKHAYARARSDDGTLWTTEIADGSYDGTPAVDEVVAVTPGADHGWPACVGDNRPVDEYGGTEESCAEVPGSQATFEVGATPTSIVVAPWDPDQLLVTLWVSGEVVSIPADPDAAPAEPTVVFDEVERPQHLTVDGDRVLLVDHDGGRILALTPG